MADKSSKSRELSRRLAKAMKLTNGVEGDSGTAVPFLLEPVAQSIDDDRERATKAGREGGRISSRGAKGLSLILDELLEERPDATAEELWTDLCRTKPDSARSASDADNEYELYGDAEDGEPCLVHVTRPDHAGFDESEYGDFKERTIGLPTFRGYVTRARKRRGSTPK